MTRRWVTRLWSLPQPTFVTRRLNTLSGLAHMAVLRLRYYSGLSWLALIGVILAVGLVASAAFFAQAVDKVLMDRELAEYSRITGRPPFAARIFAPSSPSVPLTLERAETLGRHVAGTLADETKLPVKSSTMLVDSGVLALQPPPGDTRYAQTRGLGNVSVVYLEGVEAHLTTTGGAPFGQVTTPGTLEVWMPDVLAAKLGIQPGDRFQLASNAQPSALPILVAGFWEATDHTAAYWLSDPEQTMVDKLLVRREDYLAFVEPYLPIKVRTATWQVTLDEQSALPARARNYKEGFDRAAAIIPKYLPDARLTAPTLSLEKFVGRQTALTTLLLGFNVPALGFLLYFLVLTSAVIAYWQRRETALLRSRGITRGSILNFTFIEAAFLFLIGCPVGLAFGVFLARLMGYSVSFLTFSWRPPLPVSFNGLNLPLTVGTLAVVLVAKLWTVGANSRQTVVTQEREHARPVRGPFWYRNYLDLILIVPTFYAYRQLTQRGWLGALVQERPEDLYQDPLLVLVPGLFIITFALIAMRIFPLLMRGLDFLAGRIPWFTPYLALRQLGRQSQSYINPLLLVIVSLALGVYTLSMAASLDRWLADRVYYRVGADAAFRPFNEAEAMAEEPSAGADWIPPIDEFKMLPGVASATRVGDYVSEITLAAGNQNIDARFLGIDRVDFPHTAWFRSDFAPESLGALMNRLAALPEGILVSQDFLEQHQLAIGDRLDILVLPDIGASVNTAFTIVGIYNHFPTVYSEDVAVVGNLEYIFSFFGVTMPHHIWLRLQPGANVKTVLDQAVPTTGVDAFDDLDTQAIYNDEVAVMERIGVFGTLSVSFLAAALMAALGLLTYSYASLHERLYQFSVLRAVGLRRWQIVGQVALEYTLLTAFGAAAGVVCGMAAAAIFVPLYRVSTGPGAPLPPLVPIIATQQIIPLAVTFAGLMILLELAVISSAFYRRLFEALRLGHHG
jgi:putative ABC transport system permease protein